MWVKPSTAALIAAPITTAPTVDDDADNDAICRPIAAIVAVADGAVRTVVRDSASEAFESTGWRWRP